MKLRQIALVPTPPEIKLIEKELIGWLIFILGNVILALAPQFRSKWLKTIAFVTMMVGLLVVIVFFAKDVARF